MVVTNMDQDKEVWEHFVKPSINFIQITDKKKIEIDNSNTVY